MKNHQVNGVELQGDILMLEKQTLVFEEILPRTSPNQTNADRIWIHPNGQIAAVINGVSGNDKRRLRRIRNIC